MVRRDGCCSMCGGGGMSGEECTGGMCWDCQGTGHPHLGPCGRWEAFAGWCHRRELDALLLMLIIGWGGSFALPLMTDRVRSVAAAVLAGLLVLGLVTWVTMSKLGDRQMRRERERSRA